MKNKNLQQVENLHHQKVFKCCASCRNKYITENNYRICTLMNIIVEKDIAKSGRCSTSSSRLASAAESSGRKERKR